MILLIGFAFIAGIITILSPCILPILPIVLSGTLGSKRKPLGIVTGFILSFIFFTLFLSAIIKLAGIPADSLRIVSIIIIFVFGLSLLLPQFQVLMEKLFSKLSGRFSSGGTHEGFFGGIFVGLSLGLIWTPCVGPIIASVITLAATSNVNFAAFFITLAYAVGTAIPMLIIMYGGRSIFAKVPWLLPNSGKIQKVFGVIMIITAIAIYFNLDRNFQTYILDKFPQYGAGLTKIEDNKFVDSALNNLFRDEDEGSIRQPTSQLQEAGPKAPELIPGGEWFNSEPLTIEELKGKVVLVDFWTYTCINCIRTLPYLNAWYEKYADDGLVIIGVHTPEFAFEREAENVAEAIEDFGIEYPVVQDNNYATWKAYNNRYWPAKYLIDAKGRIRYTHFGEGDYEETETAIRKLLKEAGSTLSDRVKVDADSTPRSEISPETYLGSGRMLFLEDVGKAKNGTQTFTLSNDISNDRFSFAGVWNISDEYAKSVKNSVIEYNFTASKVFLVMRPGENEGNVEVILDGREISKDASGKDVENGIISVTTDRLYEIVNLDNVQNHTLRLEFDPGIEAYAFTFGS